MYYKQSGIVNGCGGMNLEMNHEPQMPLGPGTVSGGAGNCFRKIRTE
ncbi:hypothetical protein CLOSTASPAR_06204 [[Clostridium] asparagiforme DSM 15981]|uniref:Uncharacterized protein n=1 Tax=[Clostridium] asparagiforme DSM 15981 TaxID=518636 RepID=C0DAA0_9FIRM|nr:hypothetical protein CLOSTASPAR_06204 [[Clostridium] asparagiforme DSM 15981]